MSRMLRYQPDEWSTHFVTVRCMQSRYLLRPDDTVNALVVGVLERAAERTGCRLHGVVVLANHAHLLVSSRAASDLSDYMEYFAGNVAREIGKHHRWREKFWGRRYASGLCLDDEAQVDRLAYLLVNSVKERLVSHSRYWPGVHCYTALCEGKTLRGKWVDRTGLYEARRKHRDGERQPSERDHSTNCTLTLHKLPCWEHLADATYAARVRELYDETVRRVRPDSDSPALGVKAVMRVCPHDSPARSDHSPAPRCHTTDRALYRVFMDAYREFASAYRTALAELRGGLGEGHFPDGAVLPGGLRAAPT